MSDKSIVHIGENSPEHVALRLLSLVADVEERKIPGMTGRGQLADRAYILDTYSECLHAVRGHR